jgi:hypothetical protein
VARLFAAHSLRDGPIANRSFNGRGGGVYEFWDSDGMAAFLSPATNCERMIWQIGRLAQDCG